MAHDGGTFTTSSHLRQQLHQFGSLEGVLEAKVWVPELGIIRVNLGTSPQKIICNLNKTIRIEKETFVLGLHVNVSCSDGFV